jgi:hypothetical protein
MRSNCSYDVFLSFAGTDRPAGRALAAELRNRGLRVFFDEEAIGFFEGITEAIRNSLEVSKVLVAYYSVEYATRPACQMELTAAFLAGQREGDPCWRIIVINPESGTDHLHPAELADARFAISPSDEKSLGLLAHSIQRRVETIGGVIGELSFTDRPISFNRRAGSYGFVGRYREIWSLHSLLHAVDYPLTQEPTGPSIVAVWGRAGSGKTSLVASYAWRFSTAFRGGIYWLDLSGDGIPLANYRASIKSLAGKLGLATEGVSDARLTGIIAAYIADRDGRSLWIIDNLPEDLTPDSLDELILPAGDKVRTVLIGDKNIFHGLLSTLEIAPLSTGDPGVDDFISLSIPSRSPVRKHGWRYTSPMRKRACRGSSVDTPACRKVLRREI